jgi:hypothetical protein
MHDLPPKQDKIVFVKEYRQEQEVVLKKELWRELEFQMQLNDMSLEQFVNKALKLFIDDLKEKQERNKNYSYFSEYQLFPSHPIPIHPSQKWSYGIVDPKDMVSPLEKSIDQEEELLIPKSPKKKRHSSGAKDKKKSDHV